MWWKLTLLVVATVLTILAVVPIRTHAVKVDITRDGTMPIYPPRPGLGGVISNMYLTPSTVALITLILLLAGWFGYLIVRSG